MVLQDLFTENLQSDWYRDENDQSWSKTVGKGRRKKNINMATRPEKDGIHPGPDLKPNRVTVR